MTSEFPRVNETMTGRKTRFGYAVSNRLDTSALLKYDFEKNTREKHDLGTDHFVGEGIFVPRQAAKSEDDGWLLSLTHDRASEACELRVIDCATVIAAPAAAMMLGDFGADVIKIEQPGAGDMLRMLSEISTTPFAAGDWLWQMDGRNKRSIALDLKTPEGQEILRKLVGGCDVFITNQPFSVRESIGLTYEALQPLNPRMIYASLTAYG